MRDVLNCFFFTVLSIFEFQCFVKVFDYSFDLTLFFIQGMQLMLLIRLSKVWQ